MMLQTDARRSATEKWNRSSELATGIPSVDAETHRFRDPRELIQIFSNRADDARFSNVRSSLSLAPDILRTFYDLLDDTINSLQVGSDVFVQRGLHPNVALRYYSISFTPHLS